MNTAERTISAQRADTIEKISNQPEVTSPPVPAKKASSKKPAKPSAKTTAAKTKPKPKPKAAQPKKDQQQAANPETIGVQEDKESKKQEETDKKPEQEGDETKKKAHAAYMRFWRSVNGLNLIWSS